MIQIALLGARDPDLNHLSELHRQPNVDIVFIYEPDSNAVGVQIAEILTIPVYANSEQLEAVRGIDYFVVSEPRERFTGELTILAEAGAQILTPGDALRLLCGRMEEESPIEPRYEEGEPYTIDDTLGALERLLNREELLKFLLDVAVKATSSEAGSVMLYSPEGRELYIAYATGLSERVVKSTRQKVGEGIAGTVALHREARLLRSPKDNTLYGKERERVDIASAISVPLVWDDQLLGVLNVSNGKGGHTHEEHDLEQLRVLTRRLSRVLFESLRLQEVHVQVREAKFRSTMGEIAEKNVATNEKFSILSRYLAELMGAETVDIYIGTREGDWFVLGGSNHLLTPRDKRIRSHKGTLARAFLEQRSIVLTENTGPEEDPLSAVSSLIYCHLPLPDKSGVMALEFSERHRLDEFLIIQDEIVLEVSRFVGSELKERELRRKLDVFTRVSDAAVTLLACRNCEDLVAVLTRVVADVLECERVSVRLVDAVNAERMYTNFLSPPEEERAEWHSEDGDRFDKLARDKKPFALAFLDFESEVREGPPRHHSLLAFPIANDRDFYGGIIAYEKRPVDPMEDAVFTELDQTVLEQLSRVILPILESLGKSGVGEEPRGGDAYETVLEGNRVHVRNLCESEIARANRYHHSFAIILFRIRNLDELFEQDQTRAFGLVDEITQGFRTRTRKTDCGWWISRSTYAMISLQGGTRIRFLVSRAVTYLLKDFSALDDFAVEGGDILVGSATYPGTATTADDLMEEAEKSLKQHAS